MCKKCDKKKVINDQGKAGIRYLKRAREVGGRGREREGERESQ